MNFDEKVIQAKKKIQGIRDHSRAYARIMYPSEEKNELLDSVRDLTIIIPVYNGESYIERCISSVLSQDTEFTFLIKVVNDGSTDKTSQILKKYQDEKKVEVIWQENQGVAAARNAGLKRIDSRYIFFCDADDYLKQGCIQTLLKEAYENDADIVEGGYERFNAKGVFGTYSNENIIINGGQTNGGLYGFPWNKVYKRELFRKYEFPLGYDAFEDTIGAYIIYPSAKKIVRLGKVTYAYMDNKRGYTAKRRGSIKSIDTFLVEEYLLMMIKRNKLQISREYLYDLCLHRQDFVNFSRMYRLPLFIQIDTFYLKCNLMKEEFPEFLQAGASIKEWCMRNHNFIFYFLCNYFKLSKVRCFRAVKGKR